MARSAAAEAHLERRLLLSSRAADRSSTASARLPSTRADWAIFLRSHDNIPSILALSDLAILPSSAEAMLITIVEALARVYALVGGAAP
jgi:hypothetical protein